MLQFWLHVVRDALLRSLETIGKDPRDLGFAVLVIVVGAVLLFIRQLNSKGGWSGMRGRLGEVVKEVSKSDLKIVAFLFSVIIVYHLLKSPYDLWDVERAARVGSDRKVELKDGELRECGTRLSSERDKVELLNGQVNSQQSLVNSQQAMLNTQQGTVNAQQSTVNSCVLSLGEINKVPEQHYTMWLDGFTVPDTKWKHNLLMTITTNQDIPAKLRVFCGSPIGAAHAWVAGSMSFIDVTKNLYPTEVLVNNPATIRPTAPLLMIISYDADDLGTCGVKQP